MSSLTFEAPESGVRPSFEGSAKAMFPLVFKGLALTVLTLGVYRFWYTTNVRRFLWNNVEIEGDYLEYTGRGVELFVGFLIALAVVIPLYGLIFLVGLFLGPIGGLVVQNGATVAIIFLAQFALFRARRYRLTRTVWRGVRFQQTGSGLLYATKSFGWGLLVILSLGLAYPWMRSSLERYKMANTWYGDQQGASSVTGARLFRDGVLFWIASIVLFVVPLAIAIVRDSLPMGQEEFDPSIGLWFLLWVPIPAIFLIVGAIEYRWWANGCSIGPANARCDLGTLQFLKVYAGYLAIAIPFAIVVGAAVAFVGYRLNANGVFGGAEPGVAQYGVMAGGVLVYFVVALVFAALWQLFGVRPLWRKSFESVAIVGLPALMAAQSLEPAANALGEGIADALDFGGF